jgi:hypothetical protein
MLTERNKPVTLPNRNPKGINPAMMTFNEYFKLTTDKDEFHDDRAYDMSVAKMNTYGFKSGYPKLYRTIKIHGLTFEIRLMDTAQEWGIAVFTGETKVAAVQDEWGCLLVAVAREYRGFGLGPMLVKMARTIQPDRQSGGFTPAGYMNFVKVYQSMVRDAMTAGLYHTLINQGKMTVQRAKEIIASAKLTHQEIKPPRDLKNDDPKSWLLYAGEYGDFVLYDKKLKNLLDDGGTQNDYWVDQMMKGFAYVQVDEGRDGSWAMLRQFGGDSTKIKSFLVNCAVEYSNTADAALWLEPEEIDFIDTRMVERLEGPNLVRGFKAYKVIPTGEEFAYQGMAATEQKWRKSFDRYDEFYHQMIEMAHGKYQYQAPEPGNIWKPWSAGAA